MGWAALTVVADQLPAAPSPDNSQSITVALIATLGTVIVALITVGLPMLLRRGRTSESTSDAQLESKVAVLADRDETDRRTLAVLDLHVDGIGDSVDRLRWEMDDMKAWREEHIRRHGR